MVLDGELYAHGMPFQEIEKRTAVNRQAPHIDAGSIDFHAFDLISSEDTESRQITLAHIYKPWVAVGCARSEREVMEYLTIMRQAGYEGVMLRAYNVPYLEGCTEALIKLKPWTYGVATVIGFSPGKDKYQDTLGALIVRMSTVTFNVSGGLTDEDRDFIWAHKASILNMEVPIKFRDTFNSGIPVQPQLRMQNLSFNGYAVQH